MSAQRLRLFGDSHSIMIAHNFSDLSKKPSLCLSGQGTARNPGRRGMHIFLYSVGTYLLLAPIKRLAILSALLESPLPTLYF